MKTNLPETAPKKSSKPKSPASAKCRVLVVDDHPLVRDWLARLMNAQDDMTCCGEATCASEALDAIDSLRPDVAIVDLALNGTPGIELIKDIKVRAPALRVLVLSMYDEALYAERALHAGAVGYLDKGTDVDRVLTAIRKVASGQVYLSESMATAVLNKFAGRSAGQTGSGIEQLSDRELEIFELIGHGKSSRDVAAVLHISLKTVESYKTRIKDKLGLASATELLQHAVQWELAGGRGEEEELPSG